MRINTNIASMNAQTNAANTNKNLSSSLEKLSSGLRINKAADDASGMAIADKLRTQASSLGQGISNANSGAALIQIADKALGEQSNILDTVKTKLIQASTSTTSAEGREAIRKDISKLLQQFDDISSQTNYNGINLLNEKGAEFNFQTGEYASSNISMELSRAVNTESLGAEQGTTSKAEGTLRVDDGISLAAEEAGGEVTVQTSGGTAGVVVKTLDDTGDFSFEVTAKEADSITTAGAAITFKTNDSEMIASFDQMADNNTNFTRNGAGSYTLASGATLNLGDNGMDLENLQIDATSTADVTIVAEDQDVTIKKLSTATDTDDISVTTSMANGELTLKSMNDTDKMAYNHANGIKLDTGSISVQADPATAAVDAIAINAEVSTAVTDKSFEIDAEDVTEIQVHSSGVAASVVLSTEDSELMTTLENAAVANDKLTDNGDGTFTLTASAATGSASLHFDDGIDISNLQVSGLASGSTAGVNSEQLYIVTDESVTLTNKGEESISVQGADMDDVGTLANIGETAGLIGTEMSKTVIGESLDYLKDLKENELTSDKASSFMASIDTALNQLNDVRADFGSTQSQVETAIRSMMVTQTNIKNAESVIRDTDYASESANFNKQNIIAQAGTYAMSQANALAQNVQRLFQ
jgi:flagellin